jgi:glycosyltransferase involved in cell wall biosynthesis
MFLPKAVDQKFWQPREGSGDIVCAVGSEMSDCETLIEAFRNLPIRCHMAIGGEGRGLPENITAGPLNTADRRELYAQSRFVVLPLHPLRADEGTNSILEAMAMGKPIICPKIEGLTDLVREGETGLLISPGSPAALRSAIEYLWSHPEIAERMGRAARADVEDHHTIDAWVSEVRRAVEESYDE